VIFSISVVLNLEDFLITAFAWLKFVTLESRQEPAAPRGALPLPPGIFGQRNEPTGANKKAAQPSPDGPFL
jgi:hypothetical protein